MARPELATPVRTEPPSGRRGEQPNDGAVDHRDDDRSASFCRSDLIALAAALAIIAVSSVTGFWLNRHGFDLVLPTPPLLAFWHPHVGWGSPLAVIVVLLALRLQRRRAASMRWAWLLLTGWLLSLSWLVSLTLIDGLRRGWIDVLLDPNEYLHDLPRIHSARAFLITFSEHIRYGNDPAQAWTTHVAGHPPLATLAFYALSRAGLGGGFWAGALCILGSSAVAVALPVLVRELGGEAAARRLIPLIAVFPGAVWMGVSADGLFAGVAVGGLALVAVAAGRRRLAARLVCGLLGGLLLGATLYLNYGLALLGLVVIVIAVITVAREGRASLPAWAAATVGVLVVAGTFFALDFNWFTGMAQLRIRYLTSVAHQRPYGYFVYADLGAFLISCSPLLAVAVARSVIILRSVTWRRSVADHPGTDRSALSWTSGPVAIALLCLSGVAAALLADLSGMSKAETERIWLAFGVLGYAGLALLRGRAAVWALIGAAGTALVVNHLLDTGW